MRAGLVGLVIAGLCAGVLSAIVLAGRAGGAEPVIITAQDVADPAEIPEPPGPSDNTDVATNADAESDGADKEDADKDDAEADDVDTDGADADDDASKQPDGQGDPDADLNPKPAFAPAEDDLGSETPTDTPDPSPTAAPEPTSGPESTPEPTAIPESEPVEDFPPGSELPDDDGFGQLPPPPVFPEVPEPVTPEPIPEPEPPVPPAPSELEVLPPDEAIPTPEPEPDPPVSLGPVAAGAPGNLTGNEFGCKSRCITTALLAKNLHNPDLDLVVKTNVATTNSVWVLPAGPIIVDGVPAHIGKPPRSVNFQSNNEWNTTLVGYQHDTTYLVVVMATDNQGNVELAWTLVTTTSEPVDAKAGNESPCYYKCITQALVHPGPTFDLASVSIETSAAATFQVAISTSEPGSIGGNPFLPSDVTLVDVVAGETSYMATAMGLLPETTYNIVVRVTDNEGTVRYATGSFESMAAPVIPEPQPLPEPEVRTVVTWIDRFHVHQDGDSVGKGEISFLYGIRETTDPGGDFLWYLPFEKIDAGESVDAGGFQISNLEAGQEIPPVIVNARESDGMNSCNPEIYASLSYISDYKENCDEALTAAHLSGATLEWIESLPTCDGYGVALANSTDRCFVIKSPNPGDDYVVFDALVVFRVI